VARLLSALLLVTALAGCAGESAFDRCVAHSVEEGVDRPAAEQACEAAVGDER
jgi:hypothetical protein